MKYTVDNDLHIHSKLSLCSHDENQTPEAILNHAKKFGLKTICITDHFWDTDIEGYTQWYGRQNYEHICEAKPLPQAEGIRFLFGCETELDRHLTLAITKEKMKLMDFIVIPTTHFHMTSFAVTGEQVATTEARVKTWIERFDHVLNLDLPFKKVGIAHLACRLITPDFNDYVETLNAIPESAMTELFSKAAELGAGIELNGGDMEFCKESEEAVLRPFRVAKKCGCKFYLGSDAHSIKEHEKAPALFERAVEKLGLTEQDKFVL